MNAAAQLLAQTKTSFTARIVWSQFVLETTVSGRSMRIALDAGTQADAVAYAKNVRAVMETMEGFEGCKLSREHGECRAEYTLSFEPSDGVETWDVRIDGNDWRQATGSKLGARVYRAVRGWM